LGPKPFFFSFFFSFFTFFRKGGQTTPVAHGRSKKKKGFGPQGGGSANPLAKSQNGGGQPLLEFLFIYFLSP
jgi:hypothetical protein